MEDIESTRGRPPRDIDLVTFAHRPRGIQTAADWTQFVIGNPDLFDASQYGLDAYFVDLSLEPKVVVRRTAYWFGLFSHQRITAVWKGMLQLDLAQDDAGAVAFLGGAQP